MKDKKQINYGLAFLRILMTFVVITCHFWDSSDDLTGIYLIFHRIKRLAVPVFFIMSFYLLEENNRYITNDTIKKRLKRLIVPYISWPIIYCTVLLFFRICLKISFFDDEYSLLSQLFWQLILGSARNLLPHFWYLTVLIIYTLTVCLILKKSNSNKSYTMLFLLMIASYALQYSGLNAKLFCELEYEQKYTLGRLVECIPYAVSGMFLSKCDIGNKLKNNWHNIISIFALVCVCVFFPLFTYSEGYGYGGTHYLFTAIFVFLLFYIIPIDGIPYTIKHTVFIISNYSFGIFCCHYIVGKILYYYIELSGFWTYKFKECILIYAISLVISMLIGLIPSKIAKQLV